MRAGVRSTVALAVGASAAVAAWAAPASAGPGTEITQTAVSDVVLGSPLGVAYDMFGIRPTRHEAGAYTRLVFELSEAHRRRGGTVEVLVPRGRRSVAAIVVTDRRWRTVEGIGPCSSVVALRRAYGARLRAYRAGAETGFRLGALTFATQGTRLIRSVALVRHGEASPGATSAPRCAT